MIIISPELAQILSRTDLSTKVIEIRIKDITTQDRKFYYRRLIRNLEVLETLNLIKINYVSHGKIEFAVNNMDFFLVLREILAKKNFKISFVIDIQNIRLLHIISASPYSKDTYFLAAIFGVTRKGIEKALEKLYDLGLIDSDIKVTESGLRFLGIVTRNSSLRRFISFRLNPFLHQRLISKEIDNVAIDKFASIIADIAARSASRHIYYVGLDYSTRLVSLIKEIAEKVGIDYTLVFVSLREKQFYRLLLTLGESFCKSLATQQTVSTTYKCPLMSILRSLPEDTTIFIFAPPAISYSAYRYAIKQNLRIVLIPQLDSAISNLRHNLDSIRHLADRISEFIVRSLSEAKELYIEWNLDSKYPSYIKLKLKKPIQPKIFLDIEDERKSIFYLPLGEIKLNLSAVARAATITGKIHITGEPLIGLKLPSEGWLRGNYEKPEATLALRTHNSLPVLHVEYVDNSLPWLADLDSTILHQLHIGLSEIKDKSNIDSLRPIYLRTIDFPHFWIVDRNNKTYYQLVLKEIILRTESEELRIPPK